MAIGKKVGSIKNLKKSLKSSGGGPFRFVPKGEGDRPGELTVRFLDEPDEWFNYIEHWDESLNKSYPCIGDDCPGCRTNERKASRYLANALDIEKDQVIALQMPKDLTNKLLRKYERFGTIMDRDYVLLREGSGLNTEYDCEYEDPMKRRVAKYEKKDLQELLDQAFGAVFNDGDDDDDDDEEETPRRGKSSGRASKSSKAPSSTRRRGRDDDEEDDDDDEEDELPRPRARKSKSAPKPGGRSKSKAKDEEEDEEEEDEEEYEEDVDDEDEDEDVDDDDGDDDEEEGDEDDDEIEAPDDPDELSNWEIPQLRALAEVYEVDIPGTVKKKTTIVQKLVEAIYEED